MKQQLSQPTPVDVRVGEQLEMLRRSRGLTQAALVAAMRDEGLHTSAKVVCMIENGQRVVTQSERAAFASFFHVKITHLTGQAPEAQAPARVRFDGEEAVPLQAVEAAAPLIEYDLPGLERPVRAAGVPSLTRAVLDLVGELRRANDLTERSLGLRPDEVLRSA